jgi:hypothetical protein
MSVTDRILSALTTVIRMNDKVEQMAGLMKEQQRRLDDLNGRVIRLETALELALGVPSAQPKPRLEAESTDDPTS